jgi:hypothetical protein
MPTEDVNTRFQVISQRYLRGGAIPTTNRGGGKAHRPQQVDSAALRVETGCDTRNGFVRLRRCGS